MKVYLSADIEGVTGSTHWDETDKKSPDYAEFREQMTAETAAACRGALAAGATEIWVKDAHATGRNLLAEKLPREVKLIRGWSGHPLSMVQELDEGFAAVLLVGYHSRAGSSVNPLAHTMTGRAHRIWLNGRLLSEFQMHTYAAALFDVPVVFVAGDAEICTDAQEIVPDITSVAVKDGVGRSTISIHPRVAVERIEAEARKALEADRRLCLIDLPPEFEIGIDYRDPADAYRNAFFPGASLVEPNHLHFRTRDYFEVLRLFHFVL